MTHELADPHRVRHRLAADLNGRVAVVTGATRGIGQNIAADLIRCGARVVITGEKTDDVEHTVATLDPDGISTIGIRLDVRSRRDHESALEQAVARFGQVDILVNNAAVTLPTS